MKLFSVVRRLSWVVLLVALATGCASLGRAVFATPTVQLKDVRVKAIGIMGGSMDLILTVTNPNDFRLDATRLTYNLLIDTLNVASGEIKQAVTLEAHRTTDVIVPVNFSIQELIRATQVMSQTGGADYHVTGEVTAATPGGSFTRAYKGDGHFDNIQSLQGVRPR